MKKISRVFSKLFTAVLSGAIVTSNIPSYAAFVSPSSENETIPEPEIISVIEGEPSEYGLTPVYYVDENGNKVESDLIPVREPRALVLPSKFDLRDYGYITPVKNQGSTGTCWAHATLAASESNMIINGLADNTIDLSESHLTWFTQGLASMDINDPLYGDGESLGNTDLTNGAYDRGGTSYRSRAALGRWSGVQLEENAPPVAERPIVDENLRYTSYGYLVNSDDLDASDHESIKQHLMTTGALQCSYYTDKERYIYDKHFPYESYYFPDSKPDSILNPYPTNHAVTIVGWDDNYSKDNFKPDVPPGDGAWIIKNSWGNQMHNNGYFYMSYYETSLSYITSFEIADTSTYNNIYQYDGSQIDNYIVYSNGITAANIFEAESNETISAAAFYTRNASVPYTISIYTNVENNNPCSGTLLTTQNGTMPYAGYHVVDLNKPVAVSKGTKFSVVITFNQIGNVSMALQKCSNLSDCSYYTYGIPTENSSWTDIISKYGSTACIKALTRSDITINSSNFPDSVFRDYVSAFDLDSDGALSYSETAQISEMNLSSLGISDFTGIEFFTELTNLNCSYNPIISLDVSHNNKLVDFICYGCSIQLGSVMCNGFTINGLDLSKVSDAQEITVEGSSLIPGSKTMHYTYNCGKNYDILITLVADSLTHSYGSWSDNGDSHIKICYYCGDIKSEDHSFDDWNIGLTEHSHICRICGEIKSGEHSFGKWADNGNDYHTHSCEICGVTESDNHSFSKFEYYNNEEHIGVCESCGYDEQFSHIFGDFTYLDENFHVKSCEDCDYFEKYENNFSEWTIADENSHTRTCVDCGYPETIAHSYDNWETSGDDNHSRKCSGCGYTENVDHNFVSWAYTDENVHSRICTDCGHITKAEHDFSEFSSSDNEKHSKICKDCGYSVDFPHELSEWKDYDSQQHCKTCLDCDIIIYDDHNFGEWTVSEDGNHLRQCTDCGYIISSPHNFGKASVTNSETHSNSCEICGYTKITPHSFGKITYSDTQNHSQTCDECGYIHIFEHDFSECEFSDEDTHSKICKNCSYIVTTSHSFGDCESVNETDHSMICENCGYIITSPHSFSDWHDNGNATQIRICNNCGYSETETIDYTIGDINDDGTIDSFDLVIARQKLRKEFINSVEFASADINHDGKFDITDVILLQNFILSKINNF